MKSDLFDYSGKIAVIAGAARGSGRNAAIDLATYLSERGK